MILDRKAPETERPSTNVSGHKTLYSFSVAPGRTNYIFKKVRPAQLLQVNCTSNHKTMRTTDLSPSYVRHSNAKNLPELKIESTNQISCTSFMKSYVEKLKKERKRQNKKLRDSHINKQQLEKHCFEKGGSERNSVYLAKQMDHIFILQRVSKNAGNAGLKTISLVQESMETLRKRNLLTEEKGRHWEEPAWANKEKIDKLIREIRDSRKKVCDGEQMPVISQQLERQHLVNEAYNLPTLKSKSKEVKHRSKSKQTSKITEANFKTLEPWRQDMNTQQFSIEEYNAK